MMKLALALASSVVPHGAYDCVMDPPKWVDVFDGKVELRGLNFPEMDSESWKFSLQLDREFGAKIVPAKSDPLGIEGTHGVMKTGQSSFAIATYSEGPCVLTDAGCSISVHFVKQSDGSLTFLAHPSSIMTIDDAPVPEPFIVYAPGKCLKVGQSK